MNPRFDSEKTKFERTIPRFDSAKDRFERTNPRFDSAKDRFERTNPRFDSEVGKTESKIGPTDSYRRTLQSIRDIRGGP